ncbi:MAG: hypothetical protein ACI93R_003929, partial [Flavobacteriales bacterium]
MYTLSKILCLPLCFLLYASETIADDRCGQDNQDLSYIYHLGGKSEGRIPFEKELSSLLIEQSAGKFGKLDISFNEKAISPGRAREELRKGLHLHFLTGGIIDRKTDEDLAFILENPILHNFLGYRQLLVKKERLAEFESISSWTELLELTAGQATQWPDVKILEGAGIRVVQGDSYHSLFPMLHHNRFDYLPLGAGEIYGSLENETKFKENFAIVKNIVIYYPWPIYYFVSRTCPSLFHRINYSMDKI